MIVSRELIDDLNNGKTVVSDVGATIPGITTLEEKFQFLYEACRAAVKDDLNTAKVAVALKAAGLDGDAQWLRRNLAQVIWVLVQEVSSQEALYTKVKDLVQDLSKAALVTKAELLEVGPVPFLVELGVIPFNKNSRENVIRADLFYRILKFNSLREENEGFSKMLVCLYGFGAAAAESTDNIPQSILEIKSLIGYFHLDPNKVAALLMDVWQDQWENEAYLCLLPLFSTQAISASLAFTFISYQKDGEVPPDNLYRLVVQLLKANAIQLEALWTHLYHEDAVMEKLQQDALKAAYNAFIARNALNRGEEAESRPGQDNLLNMTNQQVEALQANYKISAAALNLDPRKLTIDALQPVWGLNQKLELLKSAFEMEQMGLAWIIFGALKATGVEPADYPPINAWMARRVLAGMTPTCLPEQQHQAGAVPLPGMSAQAQQMLDRMGLSFSCSIELFLRLVRHWRQILQHHGCRPARDEMPIVDLLEEVTSKVHDELVQRILPGMALMTPEPYCAAELWSLLELLPYRVRFEVYDAVQGVLSSSGRDSMDAISLHAASDNVERMMKKVAGRMGFDKDPGQVADAAAKKEKDKAMKALTRNLAKCSHANPVIAADYLINYVSANGTHIDSFTDAMVDLSDLTLDVMTYRVIKRLTTLRQRYKPDNVLIADTFINASRFAAVAARKLARDSKSECLDCTQMHALLQMVLNAAKKHHSEVFAVLGDLMSICAAVHTLEDVGDSELPALAGGEVLRTIKIINKEVRAASRVAKTGMERLRDALTTTRYGGALAVPLFIALAQDRTLSVVGVDKGVGNFNRQSAEDRIRVVSGRYDYTTKLMIQYAEFLRLAIDKEQYRDMMPSLQDLLRPDKYDLEPEVAFLLYRPILSRVPFPNPPASRESEDGEIPDGGEAPMEVEQDTAFGSVHWSHLVEAVETSLPSGAQEGLTVPFYLLFWRFTISDIVTSEPEYNRQIGMLQREQTDLDHEVKTIQEKHIGSTHVTNPRYIAPPEDRKLAVRHLKNRIELLKDQIRLLKQEKVKMEERRQASVRLFRDWRSHLLADIDHGKTVDAFLTHCILPRCVLTTEDATYCAAFIRKLVLEDTPYFSFMFLMQQMVPLAMRLLHTMTEQEADNFGIFLREMLQSVMGWWGDRGHLAELLSKQAFRMDAISFAATAKRHASVSYFDQFVVTSCQLGVVVILKDILDANRHTTVNERAAVNSMLVLNKIRMVCPAIRSLASSLASALKPIYLRLEPTKDNQGNFTESPVPMYTFAIRCHNDLNKSIVDNQRFDSGVTTAVPAIRLYDSNAFQPKYATQAFTPEPKPQRRAPSAGVNRPAAQAEAAAAAAPVPEAPAAAVSKLPRESSHAPKTLKEGHIRSSSAARSNKDSSSRDGIRDARDVGAKEGKEVTTRDGRDRGREASSRNGKEHADKPQVGRESRDSGRATGRAADDQQLADVRAAALKATVNGTNGDASKGRSPARRDELVNGTKAAAANGAVAVPGTKRRAPDSSAPESRGSKAAKTEAAAGPQSASAAAPSTRSSSKKADAPSGDRGELRADAPEFKPSPSASRPKSETAAKALVADAVAPNPAEGAEKRLAEAAKRPAKDDKPLKSAASQPPDVGPAPKKPSGGSVKPPIHPEAAPRSAAGKRVRDAEPVADAAKSGAQPEAGKAAGDEQEPKRRKHKPIAWAPPASEATPVPQQLVSERRSTERRSVDEASARDQPRRSSSDVTKAPTKPEQLEPKVRGEKERPRARLDVKGADELKRAQRDSRHEESDRRHAQRDSHRAEPAVRQTRSDSHRAEAEAKHAQRDMHREPDSERAQRAAHKDIVSPRDSHRLRTTEDSRARTTPSSKRSASRSEGRKDAPVPAAVPEEQEDGEVQMAATVAQTAPAKSPQENGVASILSPRASPGGDDAKHVEQDDSDGKESKRSHKKKDGKEKKKKDKKEHKKDKDPERARVKAEKKAAKEAAKAKAAASAAPFVAAAPAASSPPSAQPLPAAQPDSASLAAAAAPTAAPTAAASQPSTAPRLSSSVAKADSRSNPAAPSGVEGHTVPSSSSRQLPARQQTQRGAERASSPFRGAQQDRRDASSAADRSAQPGPASQALPADDLRHMLSRGKSNTDEVTRGEAAEARPPIRRQGSHQQQQWQQQAPRTVDEQDLIPTRTRLAGPTRHARR